MKIILENLSMTKIYEYHEIEKETTVDGYVSYDGSQIVSADTSRTFIYDVSTYAYIKIISANTTSSTQNIVPYARFVDANGTLVGSKFDFRKGGEKEFTVPSGAVKLQVTDTYGGKSNQVSAYGKKG